MNFSFSMNISLGAVACVLACACSSSSASATGQDGGGSHDATTADAHHSSSSHSTATGGDDAAADAGVADVNPCTPVPFNKPGTPVYSLEAGATWPALYRDFFGPSGTASCAGGGSTSCHGAVGDNGWNSSKFLCPDGPDASQACWEGMTRKGDGGPNIIGDVPFDGGGLGTLLCQSYCVGIMPDQCTYNFTPTDMERIHAWVAAGAPFGTGGPGDAGHTPDAGMPGDAAAHPDAHEAPDSGATDAARDAKPAADAKATKDARPDHA